jgi:hypothetical protein
MVLWALGGAAFGIAGIGGAYASPVPARLIELLSSRAGEALLIESRAGRVLTERLLGRELSGSYRPGGRDLIDLRARLERADAEALRPELESRLSKANEELESALGGRSRTLAERTRIIEDVSSRFLAFRAGQSGRIDFVVQPAAGDLASMRVAAFRAGQAFEAAVPVEEGSMASRWGNELTEDLAAIEEHYLRAKGLGSAEGIARGVRAERGGKSQDVNLQEMLDYVVGQRQEMSARFLKLAERYRSGDPVLAEHLGRIASEVGLTPKVLHRIEARAHELSIVDYEGPESAEPLMGYARGLLGQLGEIKVAVRLRGVVARGLKVEDLGRFLGKGELADAARAQLKILSGTHGRELGKELDLLMEDGWLWSEVKNYSQPFGPHHRYFEKVITQARLSADIRALLEGDPVISRALKAAGARIRFRSYFVGGVTEEGAQALEQMGVEVFGPRISDLVFVRDAA